MSASTLVPFALDGHGEGVKQTVAVEGGSLRFAAEGHRACGGTDSAPSPLDFALGALTSCTQVTGQIVASGKAGVSLGRWEVAVRANLDGAVLLHGGEGVSNFRDVDLTVSVETNLDGAAFDAFTEEVEHRCPVTQLFRRSGVAVRTHWTAKSFDRARRTELLTA